MRKSFMSQAEKVVMHKLQKTSCSSLFSRMKLDTVTDCEVLRVPTTKPVRRIQLRLFSVSV